MLLTPWDLEGPWPCLLLYGASGVRALGGHVTRMADRLLPLREPEPVSIALLARPLPAGHCQWSCVT